MTSTPPTTPCISCGYDLAGLAVKDGSSTCPECGQLQAVPPPPDSSNDDETPAGSMRALVTLILLPTAILLLSMLCKALGFRSEFVLTVFAASMYSFLAGPILYGIGGAIHAAVHRRPIGPPILVAFQGFVIGGALFWLAVLLTTHMYKFLD